MRLRYVCLLQRVCFALLLSLVNQAVDQSTAQASLFEKKLMINGAGATFPYPLYSKWFSEYQKLHPETAFNYQSIGSGGGIRQLTDQTVDFGASDAPMSDEQLRLAKRTIVHIPATLGAVTVTYHLDELKTPLRLSGDLIAQIFSGQITQWNDPKLQALNPELGKLKKDAAGNLDILVVHRADGSGTTAVFSDFLCKSSSQWLTKVGRGTALRWPVGIGGKGNEGVSSFIQQMPGSIGFVELVFAETLGLKTALIENARHEFVAPSNESVSAAARGALPQMPADFRQPLTLVNAPEAYPISSFSYILFYADAPESEKKTAFYDFLNWAMESGQKLSPSLHYSPLPEALVQKIKLRLKP